MMESRIASIKGSMMESMVESTIEQMGSMIFLTANR
jgi:hypothetical protein